jgi:hypothetical protein
VKEHGCDVFAEFGNIYREEHMAARQVDGAITIGHVLLQFDDSIKQTLQYIITPIELGYVVSVCDGTPKINLAVIVLR